jgi:hypothetical protein
LALPDFPARVGFSDDKGIPTTAAARWMAAVARILNYVPPPTPPTPPGPAVSITMTASPISWTAPTYGMLVFSTPSPSIIYITRSGSVGVNVVPTASILPVSIGDVINIYYSIPAPLYFVPT